MSTDAGVTLAFGSKWERQRGGHCSPDHDAPRWPEASETGRSACSLPIAPASRADAEEGVRVAYHSAGLSPPEIVWFGGPVALARAWGWTVSRDGVAGNARHIVFDRPHRMGLGQIDARSNARTRLMRQTFAREQSLMASAAVQSAVIAAAGGIRPPLRFWMKRRRHLLGGVCVGWRPTFAGSGCGPHELQAARLAAYLHEALHGDASPALHGHRLIAENAGWFVPHEGVCWLSAPPDVLNTDSHGRLHCGSGPALRYADAWTLYAWKGTPVPAWIITRPEWITLRWIDAQIDPRVRHAMIDIFTPARFIASGGADRAGSDETGTLWKRTWSHRGVVIDSWAAVETAAEKGIFRWVPAELGTPTEASAWLFGPGRPVVLTGRLEMRASRSLAN